jgi:toxin-antitoxin system PIN domain toxin
MPASTTSFLFPDVNVWLALVAGGHVHHESVWNWYESTGPSSRIFFCRMTQLGLLRLLTTDAVMGNGVLDQEEAWSAYDQVLEDERISLVEEPTHLDRVFREMSRLKRPAAKDWADSYLIAFASASGFSLVTCDRALAEKAPSTHLLRVLRG